MRTVHEHGSALELGQTAPQPRWTAGFGARPHGWLVQVSTVALDQRADSLTGSCDRGGGPLPRHPARQYRGRPSPATGAASHPRPWGARKDDRCSASAVLRSCCAPSTERSVRRRPAPPWDASTTDAMASSWLSCPGWLAPCEPWRPRSSPSTPPMAVLRCQVADTADPRSAKPLLTFGGTSRSRPARGDHRARADRRRGRER
jgi:hypothetical protein